MRNWVYTLGLEYETASFYSWNAMSDEGDLLASDPSVNKVHCSRPVVC